MIWNQPKFFEIFPKMSPYKLLFVCLGNICRSPLAEAICRYKVQEREWDNLIYCDSCGTSAYHQGADADPRSIAVALSHGIKISHQARVLRNDDYTYFDRILVMDRENYRNVADRLPSEDYLSKISLIRSFDKSSSRQAEVPDPYYGGDSGFEDVFQLLDRAIEGLLRQIAQEIL